MYNFEVPSVDKPRKTLMLSILNHCLSHPGMPYAQLVKSVSLDQHFLGYLYELDLNNTNVQVSFLTLPSRSF